MVVFFFSWQSPSLFFNNGKVEKIKSRQLKVFSSSTSDEDIGASVDPQPIWFKFVFVLNCGRLARKIKAGIALLPPARHVCQTTRSSPGKDKLAFKVKASNTPLHRNKQINYTSIKYQYNAVACTGEAFVFVCHCTCCPPILPYRIIL